MRALLLIILVIAAVIIGLKFYDPGDAQKAGVAVDKALTEGKEEVEEVEERILDDEPAVDVDVNR